MRMIDAPRRASRARHRGRIRCSKLLTRGVIAYRPPPPAGVAATGGTITEASGNRIHKFTTSGSLTVIVAGYVTIQTRGGGGGGGKFDLGGSGGGGGGFRQITVWLEAGIYDVYIGAGGNAGASSRTYGGMGTSTSIVRRSDGAVILQSAGGGRGAGTYGSDSQSRAGASGGGGYYHGWPGGAANPVTDPVQGYRGGHSGYTGDGWTGGGGGGAGGVGESVLNEFQWRGAHGGPGVTTDITGTSEMVGGGGGGGGKYNGGASNGGAGGGGKGANGPDATPAINATQGEDGKGGGGGGAHNNRTAGRGGHGSLIISYPMAA